MVRRISSVTAAGLAGLVLATPASAQIQAQTPEALPEYSAATTPTPTPTATPTPTPAGEETEQGRVGAPPEDAPRRVRRVYRDFRRDALISPCDHTLNTLRDTRDSVTDEFDEEFPDFLESVKAAITERKETDCQALAEREAAEKKAAEEASEERDAANGSGGTSAGTGGTGTGTAAAASPTVAPLPIDPLPPVETPAPLPEEAAPPAAPAPIAPAPPAAPVAAPVSREPAAAPAPVYGLAAGGGLLALGGLLAPLLGARGGSRLAAFRHAWAEAGFRVRGIWQDFRDFLRVGR